MLYQIKSNEMWEFKNSLVHSQVHSFLFLSFGFLMCCTFVNNLSSVRSVLSVTCVRDILGCAKNFSSARIFSLFPHRQLVFVFSISLIGKIFHDINRKVP